LTDNEQMSEIRIMT